MAEEINPSLQPVTPQVPVAPPLIPRRGNKFIKFLLFVVIVGLLAWLGLVLWQTFQTGLPGPDLTGIGSPTPTEVAEMPPTPVDPYAGWTTGVVLDTQRNPIDGVSFMLPPEVEPLVCDGPSCISQGTYLPGGSRLTVAPRGVGHYLRDFRGSLISDVSGRVFDSRKTLVGSKQAVEFSGSFAGATVGGYTFSQMRGVMIEITDTFGLEMNHFAPTGETVDFASDTKLFDKILLSFVFSIGNTGDKGEEAILPRTTPIATPTSTSLY